MIRGIESTNYKGNAINNLSWVAINKLSGIFGIRVNQQIIRGINHQLTRGMQSTNDHKIHKKYMKVNEILRGAPCEF